MAGILSPYYWHDERNLLIENAHHEIGHALRGHTLGVTVKAVYLSEYLFGRTQASFTFAEEDHPSETHIQIGLAGPAATLRFLQGRDDDIFFCDRGKVISEREDDADVVAAIRRMRFEYQGKDVGFDDLTADIFVDSQLARNRFFGDNIDDFSSVFEILMTEHFNRYDRIPRINTLLEQYRLYETVVHRWVDDNWTLIGQLADHLLQSERRTTRYTHCLTGPKFRKWLKAQRGR